MRVRKSMCCSRCLRQHTGEAHEKADREAGPLGETSSWWGLVLLVVELLPADCCLGHQTALGAVEAGDTLGVVGGTGRAGLDRDSGEIGGECEVAALELVQRRL